MPEFTNWADVIGRYKQLDSLAGGAKEVTSHYILPAEYELEGRLAGVFTVPFSLTNVTAKDLVIDMVRVRAGIGKEKDLQVIKDSIDERIKRLIMGEDVMMVTSDNGTVAGIRGNVGGTVWMSNEDYHPTFGHGDTKEFITDSSQLEDERNARGVFP